MIAAFWGSLLLIFLAELGDKTQLVALTMATRFNARVVLAGVFVATLIVHLFSVGLGGAAGRLLPGPWVAFLAGLAFIVFGLWTLRGDSFCEDEECRSRYRSPFMLVAVTFFLAELGDKTMLSTVTLAAEGHLAAVWLGSSLGMVVSDGLAILVGQVLGGRLPERAVKVGAALIFLGFGAYKLFAEAHGIPLIAWAVGAMVTAGIAYLYFGAPRLAEARQTEVEEEMGV